MKRRRHLREGLSFSDYGAEDVPADVKPVHNLTPMQENSMKPEQKEEFKQLLGKLFAYLQKELKLRELPSVQLKEDVQNASKILGKTGYYSPAEKKIVLFITGRHPKDILRSFAHEVIHHWQHEHGRLEGGAPKNETGHDPKYAQNNPWLRQMEKQAYLIGNMMFRDWEDDLKNSSPKKKAV